jgi:chromate transport protein ChrA
MHSLIHTQANPWTKNETVPVWALMFIGYIVPAVVVIVMQIVLRRWDRAWPWRHDTHHAVLAVLSATAIALTVTAVTKR